MNAKFTDREIYEYWNRQAEEHRQQPSASWSDHRVIEMEIREILQRLEDGNRVLDAGCANGYSSVRFARAKRIRLRGLDYIPRMIEEAQLRQREQADQLIGTVDFRVGDITQLQEPSEAYDKVVVIRVLINLGGWQRQLQALRECTRVLVKGGVLLLSEATLQGWRNLNRLRAEWGLDDLPMPPFNQYLDENQVIAALYGQMQLIEISNFASTYYVGTRLLKPLLIRATNAPVNASDPDAEWNRWCSQLPPWGDYGTQKLFVFRKL